MTESLALGSIGQISRSVSDIERATDFFGRVLGLKHLYTFGKLSFFDCGGTRLFLEQADKPGPSAASPSAKPPI
jgi:catechol 2,3-dioxygenase-like lactoylglutathione lyase family enzyme